MDKVKAILAVMKKQHFWIMSGLVLIVGLCGWAMATATLSSEYKTSRNKIEATFKDLDQLRSQERENEQWISGIKDETQKLKVKVKLAWEEVYSEQRDKVLRWPQVLGDDFLRTVPQLPPTEEIPVDQRERYWNYAREEFPRLLQIIDARSYRDKPVDVVAQPRDARGKLGSKLGLAGGKERPTDNAAAEPEHDYKVFWDNADQEAIDKQLDWNATPSTQEVRQTQEDLWVYQSLLTIINHLNDRATGHHNAKVKEIRSLLIGHEAALQFQAGMAEGRIETNTAQAAAPSAGPAGAPGVPGAGPPRSKMPGPPGVGASSPGGMHAGQTGDVVEGRYVDEKGMTLAATAAAPPEFKRMPILMKLFMDQRELSRLLVECANSPLPVEVRQLRIGVAEPASDTGGRPMGGRNAGLKLAGGLGKGRPMGNDDERDKNPYDAIVELQGIIYIFNPPDEVKLATAATGEPTDTPAGDESAEEPAAEKEKPTDAAETPESPDGKPEADGDEPSPDDAKPEADQPADAATDGGEPAKADDSGETEPTADEQ